MKFNTQLKQELKRYEKIVVTESGATATATREAVEKPEPPKICHRACEKVVGGNILWKPVDRQAAMLLAKAPWWALPVAAPKTKPEPKQSKPKKARKYMKGVIVESGGALYQESHQPNGSYIASSGLKVTMVNGQPMLDLDEVHQLIATQIANLPKETRPNVRAAEDARKIISELLDGIGGEMEKFKANSKLYLEDIRQTRFAVVSETAQLTKELKDVRQFFLGSDYREQIDRLREFVDLCERLQKLKDCGFLDSVADTMLRLSDTQTA